MGIQLSKSKIIYTLMSLAFSFAVIVTIGYIYLMPTEVGIIQYNHEIFWVYFITFFFIVGGFAFFILLKPFVYLFNEIFEILAGISGVILLISYINFDLNEPWIIQSAYFLRSAGVEFGFLFGFLILKSALNVFLLSNTLHTTGKIKSLNTSEQKELIKQVNLKKEERIDSIKQMIFLGITLLISIGFMILFFTLYRNISVFSLFISISAIQAIFSIYSGVLIRKKQLYAIYKIFLLKIPNDTSLPEEKGLKFVKKFKSRFNSIAKFMGSDPSPFWRLWSAFIIGFILNIAGAICYFTGAYFNPYNPIPISEIVSAVYVIMMILQLFFMIIKDNATERYNVKITGVQIFKFITVFSKFIKFIGFFLIIVFLIYFHDYPIFFPEVIIQNSKYIIVGIAGYFLIGIFLRRFTNFTITKTFQLILTVAAAITLYFALELLYEDAWSVGFVLYGYVTQSYYTYFPYEFLHSITYSIMVGIPIGIILASLFQDNLIDYAKSSQKHYQIFGYLLIAFSICAGTVPLNMVMNNPGTATIPFAELFDYISSAVQIGIYCFGGAILLEFITTGIYKGIIWTKSRKEKRNEEVETSKFPSSNTSNNFKEMISAIRLTKNQKQASIIASIILGSLFIGIIAIGIPVSISSNYSPDMVAFSSNEYAIWPVDSAERVSNEIQLNLAKNYDAQPAELYLAGNEYGALQFVWKTLGTTTTLKNYTISNFTHTELSTSQINATDCDLRKEKYYIYEEFPEILEPINTTSPEGLRLDPQNVFWFNIRTPYNADPGVYNGKITLDLIIDSTIKSVELEINVNIWNFTIPEQRHIKTVMGRTISTSSALYEHYVDHRMNGRGTSVKPVWNGIGWDFTAFDLEIESQLNAGFNAFDIYGGPGMSRSPNPNDTSYITSLQSYLSAVQTHCESKYYKGVPWTEFLFWYFIDEYSLFLPANYETFDDYFADLAIIMSKMVEAAPDVKIMTTGYAKETNEILKPYISIYCPVSPDYDKDTWNQYMSEGKEFWMYTCVQPLAPMPNFHLYNRLHEIRVLNWQLWHYGCEGYLGWGTTVAKHGGGGPGHNGWGDGWFLYEVDGEIYESVRWENFLDGQEDYEYLWLLNASIYEAEINGTISETKANNLRNSMDSIINDVSGDLWVYTEHPEEMYSSRAKIASMLEDMAEIIDLEIIGERMWST